MKKNVMLTMDVGVITECKERGINMSMICEDALKQILITFEQSTLPENCEHRWSWAFTTPFGLAKECRRCRVIKKIELEKFDVTMKRANEVVKKLRLEGKLDN